MLCIFNLIFTTRPLVYHAVTWTPQDDGESWWYFAQTKQATKQKQMDEKWYELGFTV